MALPNPTTTLYPTLGMDYARNIQIYNLDGTIPTVWLNTDTLTATISPGQGLPSVFSPTATWVNAPLGQIQLAMGNAQTALLSIDAQYWVEITGTRSGTTYPLAWMWCQVLPAAGSQAAATPPDLITLQYANRMLGSLNLNPTQFEMLPDLVTTCSAAWRRWCTRRFNKQDATSTDYIFTEMCEVTLDGSIRLKEIPINYIQRIQTNPTLALTASNPTANSAWMYAATTGDIASGQTITGLVLNWESGGTTSSQTILFSSLATQAISSLASAISAVGSGWTATADPVLGQLPVTQLIDLDTSFGASPNDVPYGFMGLNVFSSNITGIYFHPDDGQLTGIVYVGRQTNDLGPQWGPYYGDSLSVQPTQGRVLVTYNGGFQTIPKEVQIGCLELVKACLLRLKTDEMLKSEKAKDYAYELISQMDAIPHHVRQWMALYKIHYA